MLLDVPIHLATSEINEKEQAIWSINDVFIGDPDAADGMGARRAVVLSSGRGLSEGHAALDMRKEFFGRGRFFLDSTYELGFAKGIFHDNDLPAVV